MEKQASSYPNERATTFLEKELPYIFEARTNMRDSLNDEEHCYETPSTASKANSKKKVLLAYPLRAYSQNVSSVATQCLRLVAAHPTTHCMAVCRTSCRASSSESRQEHQGTVED